MEVLSLGIEGKRLMWAALAQLSSADERLSGFAFPDLKRQGEVPSGIAWSASGSGSPPKPSVRP